MPVLGISNLDWMPVYYNISASVGYRETNNPHDVMLVQYFLKRIARCCPNLFGTIGDLGIDGVFSNATTAYLTKYQTKLAGDTRNLGRIDRGHSGPSEMLKLNMFFAQNNLGCWEQPVEYATMYESGCPQAVRFIMLNINGQSNQWHYTPFSLPFT